MVKPYDVSTVVSRSYISEQMQDHMQKGHSSGDAKFMETLKKVNEDKSKTVSKNEELEKIKISQEEKRKDSRNRDKKSAKKVEDKDRLFSADGSEKSILDIKV